MPLFKMNQKRAREKIPEARWLRLENQKQNKIDNGKTMSPSVGHPPREKLEPAFLDLVFFNQRLQVKPVQAAKEPMPTRCKSSTSNRNSCC